MRKNKRNNNLIGKKNKFLILYKPPFDENTYEGRVKFRNFKKKSKSYKEAIIFDIPKGFVIEIDVGKDKFNLVENEVLYNVGMYFFCDLKYMSESYCFIGDEEK